jgi:8-oxo-dGTP diphosphatase
VPRAPELSGKADETEAIDVIVGILCDADRRVLVGRRPAGKPLAGQWEFPGGKLAGGESPLAGLKRELREELGVTVEAAEPFMQQSWRYPDRAVRLDVWWVLRFTGEAQPLEGQALRWVDCDELAGVPLLPADAPIVAAISQRLA